MKEERESRNSAPTPEARTGERKGERKESIGAEGRDKIKSFPDLKSK
jgi:hypothetical protein